VELALLEDGLGRSVGIFVRGASKHAPGGGEASNPADGAAGGSAANASTAQDGLADDGVPTKERWTATVRVASVWYPLRNTSLATEILDWLRFTYSCTCFWSWYP
jgi:hypothetical protein